MYDVVGTYLYYNPTYILTTLLIFISGGVSCHPRVSCHPVVRGHPKVIVKSEGLKDFRYIPIFQIVKKHTISQFLWIAQDYEAPNYLRYYLSLLINTCRYTGHNPFTYFSSWAMWAEPVKYDVYFLLKYDDIKNMTFMTLKMLKYEPFFPTKTQRDSNPGNLVQDFFVFLTF